LAPTYCTISCDIKMEWGDKENRIAVIALHKVGFFFIFFNLFYLRVFLS
jgi:hypothetical protein